MHAQAIGKWWLLYEFNSETMSDKQACIDAYLAHNERIKATVPPERLLIWQAKDGWAPLCKCALHHCLSLDSVCFWYLVWQAKDGCVPMRNCALIPSWAARMGYRCDVVLARSSSIGWGSACALILEGTAAGMHILTAVLCRSIRFQIW